VEYQVGPQNGGNGAGCAYHRDHGGRINSDVGIKGNKDSQEVKYKEAQKPEILFKGRTEYIEEKHVAEKMHVPSVGKSGDEDRCVNSKKAPFGLGEIIQDVQRPYVVGKKEQLRCAYLINKYCKVEKNERICDWSKTAFCITVPHGNHDMVR